jgi:hypothetical protein
MKKLLTAVALLVLAGTAFAQDTAKRIKPEDMVWQAVPFPNADAAIEEAAKQFAIQDTKRLIAVLRG